MRIKNIELVNYVGIYNGIGKSKVSFSFSDDPIIVIRGDNGSGKSTLLRALNPFPDDSREIIPGRDGAKYITYIKDGKEINICIKYISTPKVMKKNMYIIIDGKDINPSGNISSGKEFIMELFGIDSQFLYLTGISSEDRGIADKKPAERKRFINSILDNIDAYNGFYKILSKKSALYNNLIQSVNDKINRISSKIEYSDFKRKLEEINEKILLETNIHDDAVGKLAIIEHKLYELKDTENAIKNVELKIKDIDNKIWMLENKSKEIENSIPDKYREYCFIKDDNAKLMEIKESLYQKWALVNESLKMTLSNIKDLNTSIIKDKAYIDQFNTTEDIEAMLKMTEEKLDSYQNYMKTIKDSLNEKQKKYFSYNLPDVGYTFALANDNFENMKNNIDFPTELLKNKLQYNGREKIEKCRKKINNISTKLDDVKYRYNLISKIKGDNKSVIPKECNLTQCPFYALSDFSHIDSLAIEYKATTDVYNNILAELKEAELLLKVQEYFNKTVSIIKSNTVAMGIIEKYYGIQLEKDIAENPWVLEDVLNILSDIAVAKEQFRVYSQYETEYYKTKISYDSIKSKASNIPIVLERLKESKEKLHNYMEQSSKYQKEKEQLEQENAEITETITKNSNYMRNKDEHDKVLNELRSTLKEEQSVMESKSIISDYKREREELLNIISEKKENISFLNNRFNEVKNYENLINEYRREHDELIRWYDKVETVKKYTSPTTGIQTVYMNAFMNNVIITVNHLLELLFDGRFYLTEFIINENEFRIPCYGNGLVNDDISSMSTSQICMLGMVISFAILYNSSKTYNIIKLDEIDGGLDNNNRIGFINVLTRLTELIHCEQCFIISHNEEFITNNYIEMR